MSKRNDMITRVAYRFRIQYVFFDVDSRKEVLTYGSVISRKNETDMIKEEFERWQKFKPYVLTRIDILKTEKVTFGMKPENFYTMAEELSTEIISGDDGAIEHITDSAEAQKGETNE